MQKIADGKDSLPLSKQLFTSLPKEKEIRDFEAEKREEIATTQAILNKK